MQETKLARCLAGVLLVSTFPDGRGRKLIEWNGEATLGCLGSEVEAIMRLGGHVGSAYMHLFSGSDDPTGSQ